MRDYNAPLTIETITVEPPTGDMVRVKLVSTGICPSDAHLFVGKTKLTSFGQKMPIILGHEGAGVVESVGESVTAFKAGDHVLTNYVPECNDCKFCSSPLTNFCMKENFGTHAAIVNRKTATGESEAIGGEFGLGTFSEYVLLKQCQVVKIDKRINLQTAAIITCGVVVGYTTIIDQLKVTPRSTVAVWGVNSFGIAALAACKRAGATNIVAIDRDLKKKDLALQYGATEFLQLGHSESTGVVEHLLSKYGGAEYAIDITDSSEYHDMAIKGLAPYGAIAFAAMSPEGTTFTLSLMELFMGKKLIGGLWGNKRAVDAYDDLVEAYRSGRLDLEGMVTNRYKLEQINDAVQSVVEEKAVRSLVVFT